MAPWFVSEITQTLTLTLPQTLTLTLTLFDAYTVQALKAETEPGAQRGPVQMAGHGQRRIAELLPSVLLAKKLLGEVLPLSSAPPLRCSCVAVSHLSQRIWTIAFTASSDVIAPYSVQVSIEEVRLARP